MNIQNIIMYLLCCNYKYIILFSHLFIQIVVTYFQTDILLKKTFNVYIFRDLFFLAGGGFQLIFVKRKQLCFYKSHFYLDFCIKYLL